MVSLPTVTPSLTKLVAENEVEIKTNSSVQYDPRVGFTMTDLVSPYGKYTCQVGDAEDDGDGDIITFNVTSGSSNCSHNNFNYIFYIQMGKFCVIQANDAF